MEYNNSLVKCISNNNYTIIDLESNGLIKYNNPINFINRILCKKDQNYNLNTINEYNNISNNDKITAFTYFSKVSDYSTFSNNIYYMKCNRHHNNYIRDDEIENMYNFITKNIRESQLFELNEIDKCFNNNNNLKSKLMKRDEKEKNSDNNSLEIYLCIILILIFLFVATLIFALIHKIQVK